MEAEPLVGSVLDELADSSFTGILEVGVPNVPLLGYREARSMSPSLRWVARTRWLRSAKAGVLSRPRP